MSTSTTFTTFQSLQQDTSATADLNSNFALVNTSLTNCLALNGQAPNQMQANLDMNGNYIINVPAPISLSSPLRLADLPGITAGSITLGFPSLIGDVTAPSNNGPLTTTIQKIQGTTITGTTGTGFLVFNTNPTITGLTLSGNLTVGSINGLTITTSTGTLTIANGKTVIVNNTLTFSGTDGTTFTFPSATDTVVTLAATQALTNKTINGLTVSTTTGTFTLTNAKTFAVTNTLTLSGTDSTVMTFPTATDTVMGLGAVQTVTGAKTYNKDTATFTAGNGTSTFKPSGLITAQLTPQSTGANTTLTTLQTFTLPANTLDAVGRGIRVKAWGTFGADANGKTITITFGGTTIYNSTTVTANGGGWIIWGDIFKTASNAQTFYFTSILSNSLSNTSVATSSITDTNTIVVSVTGQNSIATANDITCNGMTIQMMD